MNIKFEKHGSLELCIEEGLLLIKASGPGNAEMIHSYRTEIAKFQVQLQSQPWGSVAVLTGEPFVTPEASELLVNAIKYAKTLNLTATAVVIISEDYPNISRDFWTNIYQQTDILFKFCDDIEQAKSWVKQQVELAIKS